MAKFHKFLPLFLFLLLISSVVYAHEGIDQDYVQGDRIGEFIHYNPPINFLISGFLITLIVAGLSSKLSNSMDEAMKKTAFAIIAVAISIPTLYLFGATLYDNFTSESGGPVHWHADFEIWACDEKLQLIESEGFSNKVGTPEIHMHNDYRIHAEGVLTKLKEASLGNFLDAIGGSMTKTSMSTPLKHKTIPPYENAQPCPNGKQGAWKMSVNGKEKIFDPDYVISPFTLVPPGDTIKLVFE